jgi:hypothetical protein
MFHALRILEIECYRSILNLGFNLSGLFGVLVYFRLNAGVLF